MQLKESVKALGVSPELLLAVIVADEVFTLHEIDFVITSLCDSKHQAAHSLHYAGNAFDIRIRHIPTKEQIDSIVAQLKTSLTADYQVILEKDHIHIEYQPVYHMS